MHTRVALIFLLCAVNFVHAQSSANPWLDQLDMSGGLPAKLLSTRTAVFYSYTFTPKELTDAQEYFQRSGVDAIMHFEIDLLMSGRDITKAFSEYLIKREITNLVFLEKRESDFRMVITLFNEKETVIDPKQPAWSATDKVLTEILKNLYRKSANELKRQNMLINDQPETDLTINPILGKRNEFFAVDLKVDQLAVPKTGNEAEDKELEELFKANYSLKYKMTEPGLSEKDLRKQGNLYVLCVVQTRNVMAKKFLGYDMSKSESAHVSVTYPNGQSVLKNIPSNTPVYKYYFKHIESGNVFLGPKWDADLTWQSALLNQLKGMKAELRLN